MSESKTPSLDEIVARNGAFGWAQGLFNCIEGDNYLRSSEYAQLIFDLDEAQRDLADARARIAELEAEREGLRKECDAITELNHGQFLQLEYLRRIYVAADALYSESEEYDFDDGLGRGAPQDLWDELADSFEPETDAIKAELDAAIAKEKPDV